MLPCGLRHYDQLLRMAKSRRSAGARFQNGVRPTFGFPTGGWTAPDNASDAATWLADSNKTSPFAIAAQIGQLDTDMVDAWLNNLKNVTSDTTGNVRFSNHKCSGGSTSSCQHTIPVQVSPLPVLICVSLISPLYDVRSRALVLTLVDDVANGQVLEWSYNTLNDPTKPLDCGAHMLLGAPSSYFPTTGYYVLAKNTPQPYADATTLASAHRNLESSRSRPDLLNA